MSLKAGIVGLPNVGKSTLFNAITNSHVIAENYPFATINPNTGIVEVKDPRFDRLCSLFHPKSQVRATFEFTDIAGLVKGASKGEGLGNQFLGNIRNCDAIIHVVRCFESNEIVHVEGSIDPLRDIEEIEFELVMADLDVLNKRREKTAKKAHIEKDKEAIAELAVIDKIKPLMENGTMVRDIPLTYEESKLLAPLNLLTCLPTIYVGNVSEEAYANPDEDKYFSKVKEYAAKHNCLAIPVSAKVEEDLAPLSEEERLDYLNMLGTNVSGLEKVATASYHLLGLRTFFTVGSDEVRAWTFKQGMTAPECAGIIHTDFQKGFVKAEVYKYEDIDKFETEQNLKANGKILTQGKDYKVQDGDILFIKFNVVKDQGKK
ncbi:MAG: redox-regulated ATPase YchF [Bacilli bacterium]|nr:redox-regulated ATPase YchF [Bacilli bacterium]